MKPSKYMGRGVMLLLFLTAVAYFGYYAWHAFFGTAETVPIYEYTGQHTMSADGYVIREESVLQDGGSLEEIVVVEGENVAAGDPVARVYASQDALNRHQELERLKSQLERLEYIRSRGADESDAMKLNQQIVDSMTELRGSVGQGDFSRLEHQITELEEMVFRRNSTVSTGAALAEQIETMKAQVESMEKETEGATSTVFSPAAGIYSSMVDGWESSFDLETLEELTPASLEQAAKKRSKPTGRELGKVVTSFRWYYAAVMDKEITRYLNQESGVNVVFEGSAGQLPMKVLSVSAADDNGKVLVLFVSMRDVPAIASLRHQRVEVVLESASGLRIPRRALRADQETDQLGVYRISGTQAEWVPVDLIFSGEDYYLVRSHVEGELSDLERAKLLRVGDDVLVRGKRLKDGKVIE